MTSSCENIILEVTGLRIGIASGGRVVPVVDEVSFCLRRGEMLALLGESGCGKSMTALALMGLLPEVAGVLSGSIRYDGRELLKLPADELRRLRGGALAMIFQEPMTALNPVMTIGRQLQEAVELHGEAELDRAEARRRCAELLHEVEIADPERLLDSYPHELSGGMRQRVMIAMALAGNPEVLIADEPTTALDVTVQAQIMKLLNDLRSSRGMSIIFITHNLALAAQYADRCTVMYAGQVVECASSGELFCRPAHPYSWMLFQALPSPGSHGRQLATIPGSVPRDLTAIEGCRFARRCQYARPECDSAKPELRTLEGGRLCRCLFPVGGVARDAVRTADGEMRVNGVAKSPVLQVEGLRVRFAVRGNGFLQRKRGWLDAVNGVSLKLFPGETLALVGESGCGKSTVGKALVRLIEPAAGRVLLPDGNDAAKLSGRGLMPLRRLVQMIFQDPFSSLDPRLMVGESIAEGCALRGLKGAAAVSRVEELLVQVGLRPQDRLRYPHQFSGGQRQRIGLARALAAEPAAIICDECTSALDVSVQAQILNLLGEIQRKTGVALLFITHDLSVVGYLADRVAVMYAGRLLEEAPAAELFRRPLHPYTQALLKAAPTFAADGVENAARDVSIVKGEAGGAGVSGCPFRLRCPLARPECELRMPSRIECGDGHFVCCNEYGG